MVKTDYRIQSYGGHFTLIDPWGQRVDAVYPTKEAAEQDIERCRKESMHQTAKILVENAIRAHMELHRVDRETARYWVYCATSASDRSSSSG